MVQNNSNLLYSFLSGWFLLFANTYKTKWVDLVGGQFIKTPGMRINLKYTQVNTKKSNENKKLISNETKIPSLRPF